MNNNNDKPAKENMTQIITQKKSGLFKKNDDTAPDKDFINIKLYDDSEYVISLRCIDVYANQILGSRKTQQDMFAASQPSTDLLSEVPMAWAVVCDGMGGMASGELASQTATEVVKQVFQSAYAGDNIPQLMSQAVHIANDEVKKISAQKSELTGTTLVGVIVIDNSLYCASVGDSRIYLCRGNEITQLTRDHNYKLELDEMVKAGKMSAEEAAHDPHKEALISFIGIEDLTLADITTKPIKLASDDVIILCSDGLTKVLSDRAILNIVNQKKANIADLTEALLAEVQIDPARKLDNTTIAVLKYLNN